MFCLALQLHCKQLLTLPPQWSSSLVSKCQFDAHVNRATTLAIQLSGGSPKISLLWVNTTTVEAPPEEDFTTISTYADDKATLNAEDMILIDYLMEKPLPDDDSNGGLSTITIAKPYANDDRVNGLSIIAEGPIINNGVDDLPAISVEIIWNMPAVSHVIAPADND